jgi:hypothetical protein
VERGDDQDRGNSLAYRGCGGSRGRGEKWDAGRRGRNQCLGGDQWKADGTVHRRQPDRSSGWIGIEAFKNLAAAHHPVLYVSMLSSGCIALAPPAETDKVVLMGLAATAPKLTEQREWVFRFWPLATNEAPPIRMILQELKIRKLGLLYLNDAYGLSALEAIKGEFEKRTEKSFREPLRSARPIIEIKLRN